MAEQYGETRPTGPEYAEEQCIASEDDDGTTIIYEHGEPERHIESPDAVQLDEML